MIKFFDVSLKIFQRYLLLVSAFLLSSSYSKAQMVTVTPQTGNFIAALTYDGNTITEQGFQAGYSSFWRHNQLRIDFSTSDSPVLSESGLLINHTCDIRPYQRTTGTEEYKWDKEKIVMLTGVYATFASIALPRGYRFKSYKIYFKNDMDGAGDDKAILNDVTGELQWGRMRNWYFGEVHRSAVNGGKYNLADGDWIKKQELALQRETKTYVLEREGTEMGNILYFAFQGNGSNNSAAISIDKIEVTFSPNDAFPVALKPQDGTTEGVSLMTSEFSSSNLNLGALDRVAKSGSTEKALCFDQKVAKEETALMRIYEQGATKLIGNKKTWDPTAGQKVITTETKDGKNYFGLQPATYFVEAPTYVELQKKDGTTYQNPIGYRIVGASIQYGAFKTGSKAIYIESKNGSDALYLDHKGTWQKTKTIWYSSPNNIISTTYQGKPYYLNFDDTNFSFVVTAESGYQLYINEFNNGIYFKFDPIDPTYNLYLKKGSVVGEGLNYARSESEYAVKEDYIVAENNDTSVPIGSNFYITSNYYGATYYLGLKGKWQTEKFVWNQDEYGKVYAMVGTTRHNLYIYQGSDYYYYAGTTTNATTSTFAIDKTARTIKSNNYYIAPVKRSGDVAWFTNINYAENAKLIDASTSVNPYKTYEEFYIQDTSTGYIYYLNADCKWSQSPTLWKQDLINGGIYTEVEGVKKYLSYTASSYTWYLATSETPNPNVKLNATDHSVTYGGYRIVSKYNSDYYGYTNIYWAETSSVSTIAMKVEGGIAKPTLIDPSRGYILTVYDKDGINILKEVKVGFGTTPSNVFMTKFNNDAIKFKIEPYGGFDPTDITALVNVNVVLEPLNPYISSLDLVCSGDVGSKITRTLGSRDNPDFQIGGTMYELKVPKDFIYAKAMFSFENLKSDYADDTYYDGENDGTSRYNFVESPYYLSVSDNLYLNKDIVANSDYKQKVALTKPSNKPFVFNNAAELGRDVQTTETKYFMDYPFTRKTYLKEAQGTFDELHATVYSNGTVSNMYVFTTDETRYNIAPTDYEQHRAFAFYNLQAKLTYFDCEPKLTWREIYSQTNTCTDGVKSFCTDPMYGVEVGTTADTDTQSYYLSIDQIKKAIEDDVANNVHTGAPSKLTQVLYVDASKLSFVTNRTGKGETFWNPSRDAYDIRIISDDIMSAFRSGLAPNAMIYFPPNTTLPESTINVGVKKLNENGFFTNNNVILTDKQAFFNLYDIDLKGNSKAIYSRLVSNPNNPNAAFTTIILPFNVNINTNGHYRSQEGAKQATELVFHKLCAETSLTYDNTKTENAGKDHMGEGKALFTNLKSGVHALANYPYMLEIKNTRNDKTNFVIEQSNTTLTKTPEKMVFSAGEAINAKLCGTTAQFSAYGSYAGNQIDKTTDEGMRTFYFSRDKLVALQHVDFTSPLYNCPFRLFYRIETGVAGANGITAFVVSIGNNEEDNMPTDIQNTSNEKENLLIVSANEGTITATATRNYNLKIYNVSGQCVVAANLEANIPATFKVQQGLYIMNGKKILVK